MSKKNITIVIAEDHPIMLKGLKQELEQAGYTIIGTAENGKEAVKTITNLKPDIALLDIEMPFLNGFEVMSACKEYADLNTRYIVMTYHKQRNFVAQAKKIGVHGYLLKEDSMTEIEKCIATVMENGNYYSSSFSENLESHVENELKKLELLTPSERKIVEIIASGKTSTEISDMLCVSPRTIQKHRTNIIEKLQLDAAPDSLIKWAKEYKS
ncbi:response regulator transcription factor [Bizionia myxarmorum]|uniref:Response regulator transcription factor n=1 Tax=Bizionia myxarmorum TaxID=291186 RepID=A0A5D0RGA7_9FLAO|nr:response regulator transcription factor [Bizionia myxarmorum]TYB79738.1 response regulator transcription factor [Bizionia myxarmorum]